MKKINKFEDYFKGVTTGTTIFLIEAILIVLVVKEMIVMQLSPAIYMAGAMMIIGFLPIVVQMLANRCNPKDYSWTPISFVVTSLLNIFLCAFVIGLNQVNFIFITIASIPLSILLTFFSFVMVTLVDKGYEKVFKKTSIQLYALWCVLWIFVGISVL